VRVTEEITGGLRQLRDEDLYNLYSSVDIISAIR
jgi:hypothetical protein